VKWLLTVAILAAAVALWLAVTASYSDAQEVPTPVVDNPSMTATPSIFDALPQVTYHHSSDVNFSGAVNVVDLFIVAGDLGEAGAAAACAHVITGSAFNLVSC